MDVCERMKVKSSLSFCLSKPLSVAYSITEPPLMTTLPAQAAKATRVGLVGS